MTKSPVRVLVCGGRDYMDHQNVAQVLRTIHAETPIVELIHGSARGADTFAGNWAIEMSIKVSAYPADWKTHGRSAGPMRNKRMLEDGHPDLVVAFPGGRGTADMVKRAVMVGIGIIKVTK